MFLRRSNSSFGLKSFLLVIVFAVLLVPTFCNGTALAGNQTTIKFNVLEDGDGDEFDGPDEEDVAVTWEKNQEYTLGSEEEAVFLVNVVASRFDFMKLDGEKLTSGRDYMVSTTGDIRITFESAYLETLDEGRHTILVYYSGVDVDIKSVFVETYIEIVGDEPVNPDEPGDEEEDGDESEMDVPNTGVLSGGINGQGENGGALMFVVSAAVAVMVLVVGKVSFDKKYYRAFRSFTIRENSKKYLIRVFCVVVVIAGVAYLVLENVRPGHIFAADGDFELSVTTNGSIEADVYAGGDMARITDTIRVNTNAARYSVYVSAGNDNNLRSGTTTDLIRPNTDGFLLNEDSWGFSVGEYSSNFSPVPLSGHEALIAEVETGDDRAGVKVSYAAMVGEDFAIGEYGGTVEYSVIAEVNRPLAINPNKGDVAGGTQVSITTPLMINGSMTVGVPSVRIGNDECGSPSVTVGDDMFVVVSCTTSGAEVEGQYDIYVSFDDLGYDYVLREGFLYQDDDAPDIIDGFFNVELKVDNPEYGSVDQSAIVFHGSYSSNGNKITFTGYGEEGEVVITVTATPKVVPGYDVTCDGWTPGSGFVYQDMTITANCHGELATYNITYKSGKNQTITETKVGGESKEISALADFAGPRYSNVYSLNAEQYRNWTKEGYYFAYWEDDEGNRYIPDDDGYRNTCGSNCRTVYSGDRDVTLTAYYKPMNSVNKAAITLAWPAGVDDNNKMVTSNINYATDDITTFFGSQINSVLHSKTVTLEAPYASTKDRFRVAATPEFEAAAMKYYTREEMDAAGDGASWYEYIHRYETMPTNISDPGYAYGRSCDRFASISAHYGIKGLEGGNITMSFGLSGIARYFGYEGDNGAWTSPNSEVVSVSGSSTESQVESGAGRSELDYLPGDIRLAYREDTKFDDYVATCDGHTYELGHAAVYVKTEDGVGHIAEAAHSAYVKNSSSYAGDWVFAGTAYNNGGYFGRLSDYYYARDNQCYTIWRYED